MCYSMHVRALYAMLLVRIAEAGHCPPVPTCQPVPPGNPDHYCPTLFCILGPNVTPGIIIASIINFLWVVSTAFCSLVFVVGALFMIFGAGKEDMFQKGKTMMIGAIVGLAVVLSSYAMLRTYFWVFQ